MVAGQAQQIMLHDEPTHPFRLSIEYKFQGTEKVSQFRPAEDPYVMREMAQLEETLQKFKAWSEKKKEIKARVSKAAVVLWNVLDELHHHKMAEPQLDLPEHDGDEWGLDDGAESGEDAGAESGEKIEAMQRTAYAEERREEARIREAERFDDEEHERKRREEKEEEEKQAAEHDGDEWSEDRRAVEHLLALGAESGAEPKPVQKRKRDAETEEQMPQKRVALRMAPPEGCTDATAGKDSGRSVELKPQGGQKVKAFIALTNEMIAGLAEDADPDELPVRMDMLKAWRRELAVKMVAVPLPVAQQSLCME